MMRTIFYFINFRIVFQDEDLCDIGTGMCFHITLRNLYNLFLRITYTPKMLMMYTLFFRQLCG